LFSEGLVGGVGASETHWPGYASSYSPLQATYTYGGEVDPGDGARHGHAGGGPGPEYPGLFSPTPVLKTSPGGQDYDPSGQQLMPLGGPAGDQPAAPPQQGCGYADASGYAYHAWPAPATPQHSYGNYYGSAGAAPAAQPAYPAPTMVLYPNLYSTVNQNQIHLHLHHNSDLPKEPQYEDVAAINISSAGSRGIEIGIDLQSNGASSASSVAPTADRQEGDARYSQPHDSRQTDLTVWRPY